MSVPQASRLSLNSFILVCIILVVGRFVCFSLRFETFELYEASRCDSATLQCQSVRFCDSAMPVGAILPLCKAGRCDFAILPIQPVRFCYLRRLARQTLRICSCPTSQPMRICHFLYSQPTQFCDFGTTISTRITQTFFSRRRFCSKSLNLKV